MVDGALVTEGGGRSRSVVSWASKASCLSLRTLTLSSTALTFSVTESTDVWRVPRVPSNSRRVWVAVSWADLESNCVKVMPSPGRSGSASCLCDDEAPGADDLGRTERSTSWSTPVMAVAPPAATWVALHGGWASGGWLRDLMAKLLEGVSKGSSGGKDCAEKPAGTPPPASMASHSGRTAASPEKPGGAASTLDAGDATDGDIVPLAPSPPMARELWLLMAVTPCMVLLCLGGCFTVDGTVPCHVPHGSSVKSGSDSVRSIAVGCGGVFTPSAPASAPAQDGLNN